MSEPEPTHGLNCPRCGGVIAIPEGEVIVRCPYCDLRSLMRGERGVRRYQVPRRIERNQAVDALRRFLTSSRAIAGDVARRVGVEEAFLVYLPFWAYWTRVLGWIFGQERVGSGDKVRYEPREVKIAQEMVWNGAACDVGEFGVEVAPLSDQPLEPFDPESLHASGLVFEPVGSLNNARTSAEGEFKERAHKASRLERIAQIFLRFVRQRLGLVYYPLWILRYRYRGRSFQVAVDGFSGQVLYGKAPGSTLYRAFVLVAGMAAGAFVAVDASALLFSLTINTEGDSAEGALIAGVVCIVVGIGIALAAYRAFRYGEHYVYRLNKPKGVDGILQINDLLSQVKEISEWAKR